jgi:hypothetical protein
MCDEPFAARYVYQRLSARFGAEQVFYDCETIRPSTHFPGEISRALRQCDVLVAVIGSRWHRRGPDGQRLVDDHSDYVRFEIAEALRRGVRVLPVLVGEIAPLSASTLPADIAGLATRQYLRLRARHADDDASRLVKELADLLGEVASKRCTRRRPALAPQQATGATRRGPRSRRRRPRAFPE